MNNINNISNLISDRYIIKDKLGQGGSSITYAAIDKESDRQVAIKALSLTGLNDWKKIELFEREAKILQQLDHPAIPSYLDYFKIETEDDIYFYIVQQLAPGQSLAHLISEGWQPDEAIVKNIAVQILEILVYLQQLTPPVIHRDIKPQNIIYQPDTGKLFLVDFGAVQDTYHHTVMGSTVVGTYGYMAPEQYRGGAVLATDLYSLGCTLLFLLTGQSPAELPQKKLKFDFRDSVHIQRDFANWIDKLIEPNVNNRFPQAEAALLVLQEKADLQAYQNNSITKPKYSSIKVSKDNEQLLIDIPPPYKRKRVDKYYYVLLLWGIVSILNKLAIFASIGLFGKCLIVFGFYNIIFNFKKM
ncbi:Protein kinase (fragment) [Hyella patelloides LEGE 07179]|uniref:non-specific serine/threonine protein kinase n=1 Tax=Hyella patelloides LEGE 07179 TaxID=945734 RepID=A0A563W122_9CYAN